MKKSMKLYLSFIAVFMLCLVGSMDARAESFKKNVDDYVYVDYCPGPGEISIVGYTGKAKNIKIPSKVYGTKMGMVLHLDNSAKIEKISLPDDVMVDGGALAGCPNLKKIIVSKKNPYYTVKNNLLLSKDGKTLIACPGGLKSVKIPNSVTTIGDSAFYKSSIESITIGKNVKVIGHSAFSNCKKLTKVVFKSNKIQEIDTYAFKNCIALKTIKIPDSVKNVSLDAFHGCTSLKTLKLGKKVKEFSLAVLATSKNLKSVYIYNKNCKFVGGVAYKNLGGNSKVTIYGKNNSTAKKSAKKYNIKFKVIK